MSTAAAITATNATAGPPPACVEPADLVALAYWLPPSAATLVRVAGQRAALRLIRDLPGVQLVVPKRRDANPAGARRWAQIEAAAGPDAMPALVAHYGGGLLDIPTCAALLLEKRNRWIRTRFDALTGLSGPALSGYQAMQEINLALAQAGQPLTLREVQKVVNNAATDVPSTTQAALFEDTAP